MQPAVHVAAVLLAIFYLTTSYAFYNLNHYKLLVVWGSCLVLLMLLWGGAPPSRQPLRAMTRSPLPLALVCLVPTVTTLPGLLATGAEYAYFLAPETSLWLICCAWLLLLVHLLDSPEKLERFILMLGVIVLAVALVAVAGSLRNPDVVTATDREAGSFGNPNYLACFLVMHIGLLALCAANAWNRKPYIRLVFAAAAALALVALILTQSRMAMLTLMIIASGMALLSLLLPRVFTPPLRKASIVMPGCLVVACLAAMFAFPEIPTTLTSALRSTPESRLVPWRAAWASIIDAPWLGWGQGSSYALFFQYVDPVSRLLWHERSYAHAHNEVLEILQEGGVLGLLGYVAFLGVVASTAFRLLRSRTLNEENRTWVIGIIVAVIAYHFIGLTSVDPRMAVVRVAFFTLLAVLFSMQRIAEREAAEVSHAALQSKHGPMMVYVVILLLLVTSAILLSNDISSRYRFVHGMRQTDTGIREQLLEDLRDENPNVYALEQLAQLEMANGDLSGAALTLDTLDQLIPHYGSSGYLSAVNLLRRGHEQEAKAAALAWQQRDRYLPQTALLLMHLALRGDDRSLVLEQLGILLTPILVERIALAPAINSIAIATAPGASMCIATKEGEMTRRILLTFDTETLTMLMASMKASAAGGNTAVGRHGSASAITESLQCDELPASETEAVRSALQQLIQTIATAAF